MSLEEYEGYPVIGSKVRITKAGDGLSSAMQYDPEAIPLGSDMTLLLEVRCAKVIHEPTKDDPNLLTRIHVLEAVGITRVPEQMVVDARTALDAERARLRRKEEEAKGVFTLLAGDDAEGGEEGDEG